MPLQTIFTRLGNRHCTRKGCLQLTLRETERKVVDCIEDTPQLSMVNAIVA